MDDKDSRLRDFDFKSHGIDAVEEYRELRQLYEKFSEAVKKILGEALKNKKINVHSINSRAKDVGSYHKKAIKPSDVEPNEPKYKNPIKEITDKAGVRVITYFPKTISEVQDIISQEFEILELDDKSKSLISEEKFGYHSIQYIIKFKSDRVSLPEYQKFKELEAEIQVRTILQHAWAEIEHDIQYKSSETIPKNLRRRFLSLAGLLEIADREFQAIQDADDSYRTNARRLIQEGKLEDVEITGDSLKTYLDDKLGSDRRTTEYSYEYEAKNLIHMGFSNFKQVDECIKDFDDDKLSRIIWFTRQGQLTRFNFCLLAGMGEYYISRHPWSREKWFGPLHTKYLDKLNKQGITIRDYVPE